MIRSQISPEENIVRAIHHTWWDIKDGRKSSSIFKGEHISVSRLAILNLRELFPIFHRQLDTSPSGTIIGAGEINVGQLQKIGREFLEKPTEITVEEDPTKEDAEKGLIENPAHAEIPQKISRGLAKRIIKELVFHKDINTE